MDRSELRKQIEGKTNTIKERINGYKQWEIEGSTQTAIIKEEIIIIILMQSKNAKVLMQLEGR